MDIDGDNYVSGFRRGWAAPDGRMRREDEVGNMIERLIVFVSNGFEGGLLHIK